MFQTKSFFLSSLCVVSALVASPAAQATDDVWGDLVQVDSQHQTWRVSCLDSVLAETQKKMNEMMDQESRLETFGEPITRDQMSAKMLYVHSAKSAADQPGLVTSLSRVQLLIDLQLTEFEVMTQIALVDVEVQSSARSDGRCDVHVTPLKYRFVRP